ncbi:unnamed protein product [Orchesella dallaii]|uniref:GH18 domain-containing protein n=1 Tax=Orchesella dallaii TaxID=48710 RepID=A0ABP1Q836_9HEXA
MEKIFIAFVAALLLSCSHAQEVTSTTPSPSQNTSTPAPPPPPPPAKVVCYYNKLSQNRSDATKFNLTDLPKSLCTHVIYSFATLDPSSLSIQNGSLGSDLESILALKQEGVKVILSLGGRGDSLESEKFSRMVNNGKIRTEFIRSTVRFLRDHHFQGLDINWEYPVCWNGYCSKNRKHADRNNFVNLLGELHKGFVFYNLSLSVAVSPLQSIADEAYDIAGIAHNVDWVNLMTFDYTNGTFVETAIHSPFKGPPPSTVDTVNHWLLKGAHPRKLVVGIPTFGRTFTLAKPEWNVPGKPATKGAATGLNEAGIAAYFEICTEPDNYQREKDIGSYISKGDQWVSLDDIKDVQLKAEYIKNSTLGGGMIWTLDTDDFSGTSCKQGKYPLIQALRNGLGLENKAEA